MHPFVAGTQCLDGWWKSAKRGLGATNARFDDAVERRVREIQWRHWVGDGDRWEAAAAVISYVPA